MPRVKKRRKSRASQPESCTGSNNDEDGQLMRKPTTARLDSANNNPDTASILSHSSNTETISLTSSDSPIETAKSHSVSVLVSELGALETGIPNLPTPLQSPRPATCSQTSLPETLSTTNRTHSRSHVTPKPDDVGELLPECSQVEPHVAPRLRFVSVEGEREEERGNSLEEEVFEPGAQSEDAVSQRPGQSQASNRGNTVAKKESEDIQYENPAPSRSPGGDSVIFLLPSMKQREDNHEQDVSGGTAPPPPIDLGADAGEGPSGTVRSSFFRSAEENKGANSSTSESSYSLVEDGVAGSTSRSLSHISSIVTTLSEDEDIRNIPDSASALAAQTRLMAAMGLTAEQSVANSPSTDAIPEPVNSFQWYDWILPGPSKNVDKRGADTDSADSNKGEVGSTVGDSRVGFPTASLDVSPRTEYIETSGTKGLEDSHMDKTETQSTNEEDRESQTLENSVPTQRDETVSCSSSIALLCFTHYHEKRLNSVGNVPRKKRTASTPTNSEEPVPLICSEVLEQHELSKPSSSKRRRIRRLTPSGVPTSNKRQKSEASSAASDRSWDRVSSRSCCSFASERTRRRREKARGICTPSGDTSSESTRANGERRRKLPECASAGRGHWRVSHSSQSCTHPECTNSRDNKSSDESRPKSAPLEECWHTTSSWTVRQRPQSTCPLRSNDIDPITASSRQELPIEGPSGSPTATPALPTSPCTSNRECRDLKPSEPPQKEGVEPRHQLQEPDEPEHDDQQQQIVPENELPSQERESDQSDPPQQQTTEQDLPANEPQLSQSPQNLPLEANGGTEVGQNVQNNTSEFSVILTKHLQEFQTWKQQDPTLDEKDRQDGQLLEKRMSMERVTRSFDTPTSSCTLVSMPNVNDVTEDELPQSDFVRNNLPSYSMSLIQARGISSSDGFPSQELQLLFVRCNLINNEETTERARETTPSNVFPVQENSSAQSLPDSNETVSAIPTESDEPSRFISDVDSVALQSSRCASKPSPRQQTANNHNDRRSKRKKISGSSSYTCGTQTTCSSCHRARRRCRRRKPSRPLSLTEREIRYLRSTHHSLVPFEPFGRLVRQYMLKMVPSYMRFEMRIQRNAILALREAAEMYLVQMFEDAWLCTAHGNRVTLQQRDIRLVRRLRRIFF